MKNRMVFITLIIFGIFLITGCEKKIDANNMNELDKLEKLKDKFESVEWSCEISVSNIKTIKDNGMMEIQPKMFITNDGDLYQFSVDKKYLNGTNCKKYDSNEKFDDFYIFPIDRDLSLFVTTTGDFKYLDKAGNLVDFYSIFIKKYHSYIEKLYNDNRYNYVKYIMGYDSYYNVYNIKDNKVFLKQISSSGYYKNEDLFAEFPNNENFISLNGKVFKTNRNYYKVGITNEKECNEYEDVNCIEGIVKFNDLEDEYDNISYFNGNYIIFNGDPTLYIYNQY